MVKVPLLFLLTLVVTVPSLYVFSSLANSRLRLAATIRLLLVAISVNLAVLASLGPVIAFFAMYARATRSVQILNATFFTISGLVGLIFLHRGLKGALETQEAAGSKVGKASESRTRAIFWMWCVTYGVVGAQMAWILRPFLGAPGLPFQLFRGRESNVFRGVAEALRWAMES